MKLIDVLKPQVPRNRKAKRIDEQYELTRSLMPEIDEARACGYSWTQICKAVMEAETANGRWREEWKSWDIEDNYRHIKKEERGLL